jgi:molybdenum cofactor cytidylyltransferase
MVEGIQNACVIVLAAGSSSRLGTPKQLLAVGGQNLVQHAVSVALSSRIGPVLVVTGANRKAVEANLEDMDVQLAYNPDWQEGMGASIRWGTQVALGLYPETDGLLFMVCDQPHIQPQVLRALLERQRESGKPIVTSSYEGVRGTPALYHASLFAELKTMQGDSGARPLLQKHGDDIVTVPFEQGRTDIDTHADYERYLQTLK